MVLFENLNVLVQSECVLRLTEYYKPQQKVLICDQFQETLKNVFFQKILISLQPYFPGLVICVSDREEDRLVVG